MLTVPELKEYLHIDWDDEDSTLQLMIDNAEIFIADAIDDYDLKVQNERFKKKARLCMLIMVNEMYSNKEAITNKEEKYKLILQSFLTQMQFCSYEAGG